MPEGHMGLSSDLCVHVCACTLKHTHVYTCTCAKEHAHIKKHHNRILFLLVRRRAKVGEAQVTGTVNHREDHHSSCHREGSSIRGGEGVGRIK